MPEEAFLCENCKRYFSVADDLEKPHHGFCHPCASAKLDEVFLTGSCSWGSDDKKSHKSNISRQEQGGVIDPICGECGHSKSKHEEDEPGCSVWGDSNNWETACKCEGFHESNKTCPKCGEVAELCLCGTHQAGI